MLKSNYAAAVVSLAPLCTALNPFNLLKNSPSYLCLRRDSKGS
nr:MAG TPA: hypothetical protein [Bacteriophage sp.]